MKITKARLLQIIREEVELHEKYVEENVLELDEEALEELSKEQAIKASLADERPNISHADVVARMKSRKAKAAQKLTLSGIEEESGVEEDQLLNPVTKNQ